MISSTVWNVAGVVFVGLLALVACILGVALEGQRTEYRQLKEAIRELGKEGLLVLGPEPKGHYSAYTRIKWLLEK